MSIPSFTEAYAHLTPQVRDLEGFIGAILLGSVSADMQDATSDYDIQLVFHDDDFADHPEYASMDVNIAGRKVDCWSTPFSELAAMNPDHDETKEYVHAMYLSDPDRRLKNAVDRVIGIPESERHDVVARRLDSYYNGLFRSLKCLRHGFMLGHHAMAVESVRYYFDALFAMGGTIAPFINRAPYLLKRLDLLPCPAAPLASILQTICAQSTPRVQIALYDMTVIWMAQNGYQHVLDAWDGVLEKEVEGVKNQGI